jgi:hypothetical protein
LLEKSEDTKEVISSRKLKKEKQNNDQAKNGKGTNNDLCTLRLRHIRIEKYIMEA